MFGVSDSVEKALNNLSKVTSVLDGVAKSSSASASNDYAGVLVGLNRPESLIISLAFNLEVPGDFEDLQQLMIFELVKDGVCCAEKIEQDSEYALKLTVVSSFAINLVSGMRSSQVNLYRQMNISKQYFCKKYKNILLLFKQFLYLHYSSALNKMHQNTKFIV